MTQLTLDNWKEGLDPREEEDGWLISLVETLLALQKQAIDNEWSKVIAENTATSFSDGVKEGRQAIKDEAVKRIEEEFAKDVKNKKNKKPEYGYCECYGDGLNKAKIIIYGL